MGRASRRVLHVRREGAARSPAVCAVTGGVATYEGDKLGDFVPVDPSSLIG